VPAPGTRRTHVGIVRRSGNFRRWPPDAGARRPGSPVRTAALGHRPSQYPAPVPC